MVWIGGATQTPTSEAVQAMASIVEAGGHGTLIGHRDVKGVTACPGQFWLDWAHNYTPAEETGMISKASSTDLIADLQKFLNQVTKPQVPLDTDGIWGAKTQTEIDRAHTSLGWDVADREWMSDAAMSLLSLRHDHHIKAARSNRARPL